MALTVGDPCLVSSFAMTPAIGDPAEIGDGSGSFIQFACGAATFLFNNGFGFSGDNGMIREVAPGDPVNFGKDVQLTGKSSFYRGVVIAALQIELGTAGGTGALTQCALVQSNGGFRYIARVSDLTFL